MLTFEQDSVRQVSAVNYRELEDDFTRDKEYDDPRVEEYVNDYRNWPKEDAPTYFTRVLQQYRNAEWIPDSTGGIIPTLTEVSF